jgi:queuosine precursor transporter
MVLTRQQQLYTYLSGIFVAALLLGDLMGGKAFGVDVHLFGLRYQQPISVGLFAFPITFLLTDIVNEFYGTKGARFLTLLGMWMAVFAYVVLNVSQLPAADPNSFFTDAEFNKVFGIGGKLFVASIIAYLCGQFLDIHVFAFWKALTQSRHLWLRATGSTVASQVVDTFVINYLFWYVFPAVGNAQPRPLGWVTSKAVGEYLIKLLVAVGLTPAIYALHELVVRRLGIQPHPHPARASDSVASPATSGETL